MPYDLDAADNTLTIKDSVTGEYVRFRYRTPTPAEIQRYSSASIRREKNKVIASPTYPKLKYGAEIMTGVEKGFFQTGGKLLVTDPAQALDPEKEIYLKDWKDLIRVKAPHLVILLATIVFDGSHTIQDEPDISVEEPPDELEKPKEAPAKPEEGGEDAVPFRKS